MELILALKFFIKYMSEHKIFTKQEEISMCMMCVEIAKNRMTIKEGRKALRELLSTETKREQLEHYQELNRLSDEEFLEKTKLVPKK
jgi:hypothetical protein